MKSILIIAMFAVACTLGIATPRASSSQSQLAAGLQTLNFVGCSTSSQLADLLPVNITWSKP